MIFLNDDIDFFSNNTTCKNLKFYIKDSSNSIYNITSLDFIFDYYEIFKKELFNYNPTKFNLKSDYRIHNFIKYIYEKGNNYYINLFYKFLTGFNIDYTMLIKVEKTIFNIETLTYTQKDYNLDNIIHEDIFNLDELYPYFDINEDDIPSFHFIKDKEYTKIDYAINQISYLNKKWLNFEYENIRIDSLCKYLNNLKLLSNNKYSDDLNIETSVGLILMPCNEFYYNKNYKFDYKLFLKKIF
jgi:hypothetical protein